MKEMKVTDTDKLVIEKIGESGFTGSASSIGHLIFPDPVGKKIGRTQQGMALCGMKALRNAERKGLITVFPSPRGFTVQVTDFGKKIDKDLNK